MRERVFTQEFNLISPTDGALRLDRRRLLPAEQDRCRHHPAVRMAFRPNIDIKNKKTITGYFAQVGYHFTPHLKLNVGGRYSTFDVSSGGAVVIGRGLPFPPFNGTGLTVADLVGVARGRTPDRKGGARMDAR